MNLHDAVLSFLCALALTSICEIDMKCEDYPAAIAAEQDPVKKAELEAQYKTQCPVESGTSDDSGGHGPVVPD